MMHNLFDDRNDLEALIGTPVIIKSCLTKKYAQYRLIERCGHITNYRAVKSGDFLLVKSIAVEIVGVRNPASNTGVFWFSPCELEANYHENIKTNIERNNDMKTYTVKLRHPSNGSITHALAFEEFVEGDTVVVNYHYDTGALSVRYVESTVEYKLAHNSSFKDCVATGTVATVIGKVDRSRYDTAIDRRKKEVELMDKLRRRAAACEEEYLWRAMAEYDPEMKTLLDELEALKK